MSMSPKLGLSYLIASQAQKEVTHNEALNDLDSLVHLSVADRDLGVPPTEPSEGVAYIVGSVASGVWAGQEGHLAFYYGGWVFKEPRAGWIAFVQDEARFVFYNGSAWAALSGAV